MNKFCRIATTGLVCASAAMGFTPFEATAKVTLWTCGDSTMATYDPAATNTRGWGQYFGSFFQGDIEVINKGKGGMDVHGFITGEAYWPYIKKNLKPGDYVLLQFAHNDEKNGGMDGYELRDYYIAAGKTAEAAAVDLRGSVPNRTYIAMLEDLVKEIRAAGANPVFASSICRMYFNGNDIRRNGRHDLGDNFSVLTPEGPKANQKVAETDHSMDFTYQMAQLADKLNVPYIDLMQATRELYVAYGDSRCHDILSDGEGSTHLSTAGAVLIARRAAELMQDKNVLSDYINLGSADISFNPATGDLGEAYAGNILTSEFTVTGFGLTPETGTVEVTVTDGFEISTDKSAWGTTGTMSYDGGTLIGTLYVRASLENPGTLDGTITVKAGNKTATLPVSATATPMPGSGQMTATWPLTANGECTLSGDATVVDARLVGLKAMSYDGGINLVPTDGTWPEGDIDESPTRYIEFSIRPAEGKVLQISNISMNVVSPETDALQCHANYSTDAAFANPRTFWSPATIERGTTYQASSSSLINIDADGVMLVRVYPWAKYKVTNAPLRISDVTISGYSSNATQTTSLVWPLGQGSNDPVAAETTSPLFSYTSMAIGSDLTSAGAKSVGGMAQSLYQPTVNNQSNFTDAASVTFTVVPKKGVTFRPTNISLNATRYGTDGGVIEVSLEYGDKKEILGTSLNPIRNNQPTPYATFNFPVNGAFVYGEPITLRIAIAKLGNSKQLGFHDIRIEGEVSGTPIAVPSYKITVAKNYDEAGEVKITPDTDRIDEGSNVKLEATENFGYSFSSWQAEGKTISTDNPYSFTAEKDMAITAVYVKHNIYPLSLEVDGANDYMVTVTPDGEWIDGKRWYVEGTDVLLSTTNNRVLTFTNWEDNTTSQSRTIRMNAAKDVKATFSADDFIVGWDLTLDDPKSERAADIKAASDNAGLLSLHNDNGTTTSWLNRGIGNGMESGRYAARIWKLQTEKHFFEISFSAAEYRNLKIVSAMGAQYNSYGTFFVQCSTDGKEYTTIGEIQPATRAWTDSELALPASYDGAKKVYIRWYPDWNTKNQSGNSPTDYDGVAISGIYVLAEPDASDDSTAPVLTATIPAQNAEGASVTGSIILSYDEKVQLGSGAATLAGKELTATISGKSVVFPYSALDYDTQYTFSVPEGFVTDRSGNKAPAVSLTFTTMKREQPEPRLFDAIVDCNGAGDYTSVQAAIDAAPADRVKPWLILVLNGNYKEHIDIPASKPFMHIIGQDRDKTVILDDRLCGGDNAVHVSVGATVVVNANDCMFQNITLENSYGHEKLSGPQALALNTIGDRVILNNVAVLSYQDTWITTSKSDYRAYVKDSFIEGAVDFIYNSGDLYCENTTLYINRQSGGFIVAPSHGADVKWGYVFRDCTITAPGDPSKTSVWLGRPWHNFPKTVFLNTRAEVTIPATGWYETMGGLPVIWAEWNTTDANGNLLDLSQRRDTYYRTDENGNKVYGTAKNILTDEEAAQYTVQNVLSGNDAWQPAIKTEPCAQPDVKFNGNELAWEPVPYAICYVIFKNDKYAGMTTDCYYPAAGSASDFSVYAVNEFGGFSPKASAVNAEFESELSAIAAEEIVAVYDIHGRRLVAPVDGVNILVIRDANGHFRSQKLLKR